MDRNDSTRLLVPSVVLTPLLLALCFIWSVSGSLAAPLNGPGSDPAIGAIGVAGTLPISDTLPVVYFANSSPGAITLTLEISGTAPLTLTAGAAFGAPVSVVTSTVSPWGPEVSYTVETSSGDWLNVLYSVTNTVLSETVTSLTFLQDVIAPEIAITVESNFPGIAVSWTANDAGSGVTGSYDVETATDVGAWEAWLPVTYTTSAYFEDLLEGEHEYHFRVTAYDFVGNVGQEAKSLTTERQFVYLPAVSRRAGVHYSLRNGDFGEGQAYWASQKGAFGSHGTGLPWSVAYKQALLGNSGYSNDHIPVGYGGMSQTFKRDGLRYLSFNYRVMTYDKLSGSGQYFDAFEVSMDKEPSAVTDADRASPCASPGNGVDPPPDGGLVLCDGYNGTGTEGTLRDLGAKSVVVDLDLMPDVVTLYFTVWSREYDSPFYDDRAWYNTWVTLTDVALTAEDPSGSGCALSGSGGSVVPRGSGAYTTAVDGQTPSR